MAAIETDVNLEDYLSIDGRHGRIWCLSWSPKPCNGADHMLASCGDSAIVWHCRNSVWSQIMVPYEQIVKSLSWSKRGLLLSCTNDGCISIVGSNRSGGFNVKCRAAASEITEVSCAEWDPEGIVFALGEYQTTKVYQAEIRSDEDVTANGIYENGALITHPGDINSVSFWSDGNAMLAAGDDLIRFLVLTGSGHNKTVSGSISDLEHKGVMCCDWSRCREESIGYLIASGCYQSEIRIYVQYMSEDNSMTQYRLVTRKIEAHGGSITNIKWHPTNPRLLASTGLDRAIKIWRVTGSVPYRGQTNGSSRRKFPLINARYEDESRNIRARR